MARGEMTTRNEVVLIVWRVGDSMKHSNHMKIIILSPKKETNFHYHQGVKAYVTFVFVHTELSYRYMCKTVASNRKKLNKWDHEGRGGRILYGDRYGG